MSKDSDFNKEAVKKYRLDNNIQESYFRNAKN